MASDEPAAVAEPFARGNGDSPKLPTRRPTGRFPLRRIVSPSLWKTAGLGLLTAVGCAAVAILPMSPPVNRGDFGPAFAAWCSGDSGRLPAALAAGLLLLTGQLAWLIRWARARSLRDFDGSYRLWGRLTGACLIASAVVVTEAHTVAAETLVWITGRRPPGGPASLWMAPASATIVLFQWRLWRELRDCRPSRLLVSVAAGCWLCALASRILFDSRTGLVSGAVIANAGLTFGATAAFTGVLFHARHVVYVSVEPPEAPVRPARVALAKAGDVAESGTIAAEVLPVATQAESVPSRRRSTKRAAVEQPTTATVSASARVAVPDVADESPAQSTPDMAVANTDMAERPIETIAAEPPDEPEPVHESATADGRRLRLDAAEDPLRGMSKRERRRLKQTQRHGAD